MIIYFADELKEWLLEAGFIKYQFHMYIFYKYAPYVTIFLFYLMLMTVSIDILLELLENGLWMIQERDPM